MSKHLASEAHAVTQGIQTPQQTFLHRSQQRHYWQLGGHILRRLLGLSDRMPWQGYLSSTVHVHHIHLIGLPTLRRVDRQSRLQELQLHWQPSKLEWELTTDTHRPGAAQLDLEHHKVSETCRFGPPPQPIASLRWPYLDKCLQNPSIAQSLRTKTSMWEDHVCKPPSIHLPNQRNRKLGVKRPRSSRPQNLNMAPSWTALNKCPSCEGSKQTSVPTKLSLMPTSHWPNGMGKLISMASIDKPTPVRKVQLYQLAGGLGNHSFWKHYPDGQTIEKHNKNFLRATFVTWHSIWHIFWQKTCLFFGPYCIYCY